MTDTPDLPDDRPPRLEEIDDRLEAHDDEHHSIRAELDRLRASLEASREGEHERAAELLDDLEDESTDGTRQAMNAIFDRNDDRIDETPPGWRALPPDEWGGAVRLSDQHDPNVARLYAVRERDALVVWTADQAAGFQIIRWPEKGTETPTWNYRPESLDPLCDEEGHPNFDLVDTWAIQSDPAVGLAHNESPDRPPGQTRYPIPVGDLEGET